MSFTDTKGNPALQPHDCALDTIADAYTHNSSVTQCLDHACLTARVALELQGGMGHESTL